MQKSKSKSKEGIKVLLTVFAEAVIIVPISVFIHFRVGEFWGFMAAFILLLVLYKPIYGFFNNKLK